MTGSEKIVARINGDAEQKSRQIIASAEDQAAKVLEAARAEAKQRSDEIISAANDRADHISMTAKSSAELSVRNALLACRRAEIEKTLTLAAEHVCGLPDNEYFAVIEQLIAKNTQSGKGTIAFNKKDLTRLPAGFAEKLEKYSLTVQNEPADINGGFILRYSDIEINCGISAMLEDKRDILEDMANKELF